jgi:hypothetical protein
MSEIKRDAAADLALCEAATPGPWFTGIRGGQCHKNHEHGNRDCVYDLVLHLADDWVETTVPGEEIFEYGYDAVRIKRPETAKFMAESREALPHWIKRAQDAEKRISAACDKLNSLITLISMAGGAGESVDIWGLSSELCAIASELNSE